MAKLLRGLTFFDGATLVSEHATRKQQYLCRSQRVGEAFDAVRVKQCGAAYIANTLASTGI
ncbi:hypothetical protein QN391_18840 [Pseudomonas sp. CCI1.2]|uniref:hypothetical protein n=1 Tax=Pseudomonas sp. CCI1.2 TaxID=3048614 RepID=UPI002B23B02B|nr:hypothetical protein [Pseudomonas sp. CCI1.2]MEB0122731.1 hypothetical protein [Pseudomonas sp. CCI1.2]